MKPGWSRSSVVGAAILGIALCCGNARAQEAVDWDSYHRAVEYCRGDVSRPLALSPDRLVLCFDGVVARDTDVSPARDLNDGGFFVVRSPGGNEAPAIVFSDLLRARNATVVVFDYCLSACAVFLLVASHQTFVVKDTLVAWHYPANSSLCTSVQAPRDGGPRKLRRGPCRNDSSGKQTYSAETREQIRFFKERAVSPLFEAPADSLYVRKIIRSRYAETGVYRDTAWTIHPRYYPTLFKTKIVYEAYPESQAEVDSMVSRMHLGIGVIHDP